MFTSRIDGNGFQMTFPSGNKISVIWAPSKEVGPPGDERSAMEAEVAIFDYAHAFITHEYVQYFKPFKDGSEDKFTGDAWGGLSVSDVADIIYIMNREG